MDKTTKIIVISCVGVVVIAGVYFYVSSKNAAAVTTANTGIESCVPQTSPLVAAASKTITTPAVIKPQADTLKPIYTACAAMVNRLGWI